MTQNQTGWFLFAVGLLVIGALLVGDLVTLFRSHGTIDNAFVMGMLAHVSAPILAFSGGKKILPAAFLSVSDAKRAELSKDVMSV